MPIAIIHTVKPVERLSQIAARYGMSSKAIYDDPANRALRAKKPNPNIMPGDQRRTN